MHALWPAGTVLGKSFWSPTYKSDAFLPAGEIKPGEFVTAPRLFYFPFISPLLLSFYRFNLAVVLSRRTQSFDLSTN